MEEIAWLIRGLNEDLPGTRLWHVEALGRTANPDAAPPLCALLRDEAMRDAALEALERLGDAAVEPLCRELKVGRRDIHPLIIRVLKTLGDTRAVPLLCEALKEKDWRIRAEAFEALDAMGALSDPRAALPLIEVLKGPNWEAADRAAVALGESGDARAVPPLVEAVLDGHDAAGEALGKIAPRDPVPELRAALPALRQRLLLLTVGGQRGSEAVLRTAMRRIEAATAVMNLPLPSEAPPPAVESLPLPAPPPAPEADELPLPAAAPPAVPSVAREATSSLRVSASVKVRPWWQGLRQWLRGDD